LTAARATTSAPARHKFVLFSRLRYSAHCHAKKFLLRASQEPTLTPIYKSNCITAPHLSGRAFIRPVVITSATDTSAGGGFRSPLTAIACDNIEAFHQILRGTTISTRQMPESRAEMSACPSNRYFIDLTVISGCATFQAYYYSVYGRLRMTPTRPMVTENAMFLRIPH